MMDKMEHIQQFHMKCEKGKKLDFVKEIFDTCEMTQTFIFVNTKNFAERIYTMLNQAKYPCHILFSKMDKEERDACMAKFRKQEVNVLVTTNIIARGIDIPDAQLVINYDVPTENVGTDRDR